VEHRKDKERYHNWRCIHTMKLVSDDGTTRHSRCRFCGIVVETCLGMCSVTVEKEDE
jgi:hypothetical protein